MHSRDLVPSKFIEIHTKTDNTFQFKYPIKYHIPKLGYPHNIFSKYSPSSDYDKTPSIFSSL